MRHLIFRTYKSKIKSKFCGKRASHIFLSWENILLFKFRRIISTNCLWIKETFFSVLWYICICWFLIFNVFLLHNLKIYHSCKIFLKRVVYWKFFLYNLLSFLLEAIVKALLLYYRLFIFLSKYFLKVKYWSKQKWHCSIS